MAQHSYVVLTLVSRGEANAPGQGSELLLFAAPERRARGEVYSAAQLDFALHSTVERPSSSSPLNEVDLRAASAKSIKDGLLLEYSRHVQLVRSSALLPWSTGTTLQIFLWRMSTSYERGLDREFGAVQGDEGEDESAQGERAAYREVEARLGRGAHAWETFEVVERDMTRLKHELLSAAFHSVILPPALDDALYLASTLCDKLAPFELADLAFNCFLELVQVRAGETAFRGTWPIGVPQPSKEMLSLPDEVVKDRLLRYWRDVVAHYFQHAAPAASSALSALFLRILLPLQHLARSPAADAPLAAFLRSAADSILSEGTRIRLAAASLDKLAVAKVLERASLEKRPILHVLAAGNDPLVAGVLQELVHYVTTISAHPCAPRSLLLP